MQQHRPRVTAANLNLTQPRDPPLIHRLLHSSRRPLPSVRRRRLLGEDRRRRLLASILGGRLDRHRLLDTHRRLLAQRLATFQTLAGGHLILQLKLMSCSASRAWQRASRRLTVASETPIRLAISAPDTPAKDNPTAWRSRTSDSLRGAPRGATSAREPRSAALLRSRETYTAESPNSAATSFPGTPACVSATTAKLRIP